MSLLTQRHPPSSRKQRTKTVPPHPLSFTLPGPIAHVTHPTGPQSGQTRSYRYGASPLLTPQHLLSSQEEYTTTVAPTLPMCPPDSSFMTHCAVPTARPCLGSLRRASSAFPRAPIQAYLLPCRHPLLRPCCLCTTAATAAVTAATGTPVDTVPLSDTTPDHTVPVAPPPNTAFPAATAAVPTAPPLPPLLFLLTHSRYCRISLHSRARLPRTTSFHAVIHLSVPSITHPTGLT